MKNEKNVALKEYFLEKEKLDIKGRKLRKKYPEITDVKLISHGFKKKVLTGNIHTEIRNAMAKSKEDSLSFIQCRIF